MTNGQDHGDVRSASVGKGYSFGDSPYRAATLLAILLILATSTLSAQQVVHYSADHRYAFPVAGRISLMWWAHRHWDGSNAVDIVADPALPSSSPLLAAFGRLAIVAVADGVAAPANNELGGIALTLKADDGHEYYYAHLHDSAVSRSTRVHAGQTLGHMGHTGRWTWFIEPHLYFSITSHWHSGLSWVDDINAADWIRTHFGYPAHRLTIAPYPPDRPHVDPIESDYRVMSTFGQTRALDRDLASVELCPNEDPPQGGNVLIPINAPLTGEVRVFRNTVLGLRVQVTNRHTDQTIVLSGLAMSSVRTGMVVSAGSRIGYTLGAIDYMYFDSGTLTDPQTVMH